MRTEEVSNDFARISWLSVVVLLGSIAGCGLPNRSSRSSDLEKVSAGLTKVQLSSNDIDFGELKKGGRAERELVIRNTTETEIVFGPVETSCECLSLDGCPKRLAAGQSVTAKLVVDFGHELDFMGGLDMELKGQSGKGERLFTLNVRATVVQP